MMDRRTFIGTVAGGLVAMPLVADAQKPVKGYRVAFLINGSFQVNGSLGGMYGIYDEVQKGLRDLGYIEGKNIDFVRGFANDKPERLPGLAAELVALKPDIIFSNGSRATLAAKQATATIPIVMNLTADPVGSGFVESLARPGRNITGTTNFGLDISVKQVEMLRAVAPTATRIAVLVNDNPAHPAVVKKIVDAASRFQLIVLPFHSSSADDVDMAFASMAKEKAEALIVVADPVFGNRSERIAKLAAEANLPAIYAHRSHVEAGGLLSYGPNTSDNSKIVAGYIDKILKGAKPGDLPVQQPTKFELVINLKTAKALGLTIPQLLLLRADEVVQ